MFTTLINRKSKTNFIFGSLILVLIVYVLLYAYNVKESKTQTLTDSFSSIKCLSNICLTYDNIKECIHIEVPTLFRIETLEDINFSRTEVRNMDFISIKEDCK